MLTAPPSLRGLIVSARRAGEERPKLAMKPERPHRHNLVLRGVLHCGIESIEVRVRNISSAGTMLDCSDDLLAGAAGVLGAARGARSAPPGRRRRGPAG